MEVTPPEQRVVQAMRRMAASRRTGTLALSLVVKHGQATWWVLKEETTHVLTPAYADEVEMPTEQLCEELNREVHKPIA